MRATGPSTNFIRIAPALFVFLWSTGYVGARFGLPYIEPMTLAVLRFSIVVGLLAAIVAWRRERLPRDPRLWVHLAVSGILIHACFVGGVFTAIHRGVDIAIAALIAGVQPLLTAVIGVRLLGESLSARQWMGFGIGFVGLSMVVGQGFADGALPWAGFVGCIVGLLGITLGTLYQKRYIEGVDLFAGSAVQFAAALLPCAVLAFALESQVVEWNLTLVLVTAWLCVVMSVGAISILLFLIREGAASKVSSLFYLVPPVTAVQGYLLFDQRLSGLQLAGIVVTAIGVAMINLATKGAEKN
jgi:drug/metabolite transporter (DMT)-like permease